LLHLAASLRAALAPEQAGSSLTGSNTAVRQRDWAGHHHIPYPPLVIEDERTSPRLSVGAGEHRHGWGLGQEQWLGQDWKLEFGFRLRPGRVQEQGGGQRDPRSASDGAKRGGNRVGGEVEGRSQHGQDPEWGQGQGHVLGWEHGG
jgi:hypothetical protein